MEFLNKVKDFCSEKWNFIRNSQLTDFLPLNKKFSTYEPKGAAILTGIYLGALVISIILLMVLGTFEYVGWLFRIIFVLTGIYSLVGLGIVMRDISRNF